MFNPEYISKIFRDFIKQTSSSTLKINFDDGTSVDYHLSLNYDIEHNLIFKDDSLPLLRINNFDYFIEKLTELLNLMALFHSEDKDYYEFSDYNFATYLLMSFITNMQEKDFNYPLDYIKSLINAYSNDYNLDASIYKGSFILKNKTIRIYEQTKKNIASMEAPVYKQFIFEDDSALSEDQKFYFSPKIHYYISNDETYIKGIQSRKKVQKNKISKDLDRYFRKVDEDFYPELEKSENGKVDNIKDVSPSFLVALSLFVAANDTNTINLCDYMPLKYQNKVGVLSKRQENLDEADRIQWNTTNRFLLTGLRLTEHFNNLSSDFYNGCLIIKKSDYIHKEGNILYHLYEIANKNTVKKQ